ncbi:MAG TPA: rhomboid family intramembrane serine protease, partial [Tepidisphaeraceae bacterium]|nr:rhomboid family intramembrane serine protease [Tepidisphaeraceae bacterium]
MIIPLRTDSPLRTTPYMNWGLIASNIAVFVVTLAQPHLANGYGLSPRQPQLFQFFTYQFLHEGWLHIAGNMLFLYIFGNNVNDRLGHIGYLALYLAGGVFAGISYTVTSSGAAGQMVGASGSISAVTGAFLVLLPRSNVTIVYFWYLIGMTEIASAWLIAGFFALDIFEGLKAGDSVAHMAHIGGTIFGIFICSGLLSLQLLPRDPFDIIAMFKRWNRRRQYRDMVATGYNPFEYTVPERARRGGGSSGPPPPPDARTQRILDLRASIAEALAAHDLDQAARLYLALKAADPQQVLARQQQLDIANHLASQQLYAQAAEAYESFLKQYGKSDQVGQVELMLGLMYARYLNQPARARDYLIRAASKYHAGRE